MARRDAHPARSDAFRIGDRSAPVPDTAVPGELVVFLHAGSVWTMRPDGSDAMQLTVRADEAADESPKLSPDGTRIAFTSGRGGVRRIYALSLSELITRPLTDGAGGGDGEPAWSPDSQRLAFMRGDPRIGKDLYVVDAAGGKPVRLLAGQDDHPEASGSPAWSPDGKTIALASDRRDGKGTAIWLVELSGGALTRLTPIRLHASYSSDRDPCWSPDGKTIAFSSNRHVGSADDADDFDIYAISADGSGLTRLTSDPGVAVQPAYSPDGNRIFFASTRDRAGAFEWELYVMASGGGVQRRVTRDERPQNTAPSVGVAK